MIDGTSESSFDECERNMVLFALDAAALRKPVDSSRDGAIEANSANVTNLGGMAASAAYRPSVS